MTTQTDGARTAAAKVRISDGRLIVSNLEVDDPSVAEFFDRVPTKDQAAMVATAIQVGVLCLERASTRADVDYLKKETSGLVHAISKHVDGFGKSLVEQVGTGKGQALFPVKETVERSIKLINERVEALQKALSEEMDPTKKTSRVARSLEEIRKLVDPENTSSIQHKLDEAVKKATADDGVFAARLEKILATLLEPIRKEVKELTKTINQQEIAEELVEKTTLKGAPFEAELVDLLKPLEASIGAQVEHVGADNRPGDIILEVPSVSAKEHRERIVVEAKDEAKALGRKALGQRTLDAMNERDADGCVWINRNPTGFANDIGDYAEGSNERGPWIAATVANALMAVRHMRVLLRLRTLQATQPDVDVTAIQGAIQRVRDSMNHVKNLNTKAGDVTKGANAIRSEAQMLRNKIEGALFDIEAALRTRPENAASGS